MKHLAFCLQTFLQLDWLPFWLLHLQTLQHKFCFLCQFFLQERLFRLTPFSCRDYSFQCDRCVWQSWDKSRQTLPCSRCWFRSLISVKWRGDKTKERNWKLLLSWVPCVILPPHAPLWIIYCGGPMLTNFSLIIKGGANNLLKKKSCEMKIHTLSMFYKQHRYWTTAPVNIFLTFDGRCLWLLILRKKIPWLLLSILIIL